jgi:quercetin dioxygenase-like cupin family protein
MAAAAPVLRHADQPTEDWRPGVRTRMQVSALTGARQLCVFEQWCEPGTGAPLHRHAVEEILTVIQGTAEVRLAGTVLALEAGQSVIVQAGDEHGFTNRGTRTLHMRAILAAPVFEADFAGSIVRRWSPDLPVQTNEMRS